MKRNTRILTTATLLFFASEGTYAGWFGPDSYDECILDKMKGQDTRFYSYAGRACREKFPVETQAGPSVSPIPQVCEYELIVDNGRFVVYRDKEGGKWYSSKADGIKKQKLYSPSAFIARVRAQEKFDGYADQEIFAFWENKYGDAYQLGAMPNAPTNTYASNRNCGLCLQIYSRSSDLQLRSRLSMP